MLELQNVSVSMGQKQILRDISFFLKPNRLTALVGRNGSGKSTLLSCVNQQTRYQGHIFLDGADLAKRTSRDRAKAIAILPQTLPAPTIPVEEMVAFGRNPYLDFTGRLTQKDKAAVSRALVDADAAELAGRYVDSLSGGEKQRVALAMILAQNTPIALLDEPTAHMDLSYEAAFLDTLRKLKTEKQKTFLVILHDLSLAAAYADDILVLDRGKLVFAGNREACLEQNILETTFALRRYYVRENGVERVFFAAR